MRRIILTVCAGCNYSDSYEHQRGGMETARRQLRQNGWRIRAGRWHCSACVRRLALGQVVR